MTRKPAVSDDEFETFKAYEKGKEAKRRTARNGI